MIKYILRRLLVMIPVLLGVVFIIFTINYFSPGDPALIILGSEATQAQIDQLHADLGLDLPFFVQFFNYIKGIVTHLDLGTSYITKTEVRSDILARFPSTFKLAILSTALATLIGIPLGVIAATKQTTLFDYASTFLALIGASMPSFWLGLMLIILFSLNLGLLPASGLATWRHWILPTVAISVVPIANITRTTRSSMLEVIRQDYIRTARSKGLKERKIITKHALANAIIPVITIIGILLAFTMGGLIVLETVFSVPGMGTLMKKAISYKDYPTIQGCVLFIALIMSVMNLLIDILYAFIDPRIKSQYVKRNPKNSSKKIENRGDNDD